MTTTAFVALTVFVLVSLAVFALLIIFGGHDDDPKVTH